MDNEKRNKLVLEKVCSLLEKMNVEVKDAYVEDGEIKVPTTSNDGASSSGDEVEQTEQVLVGVEVENPAILIGFKGRTLMPLQFVISLMVKKEIDKWVRVLLDINGYRGEQKERLESKVAEAVDKVLLTKEKVDLPGMSSYERRICHMAVAGVDEVMSESEGEGWDRHVVVKPVA